MTQALKAPAQDLKAPGAAPDGTEFAAFWSAFRTALIASDWPALARMTRFPVSVNGELDDEPVRKVDRAGFSKLMQKLLAQKSQADESITVRRYVEQTTHPKQPASGRDHARVNEFQFERSAGSWVFYMTYLDSNIEL